MQKIPPKKESIVKLYKSKIPLFEKFGIERQIKTSFGKNVTMTKGSYLVIEHTEALHVIDVNSGNRRSSAKNQEESALEVNLVAATEIARQLRLRDMGGIIVVSRHFAPARTTTVLLVIRFIRTIITLTNTVTHLTLRHAVIIAANFTKYCIAVYKINHV